MTEHNFNSNSAYKNAKFIVKYGALYSGFVTLVSDVLKPLFEFTLLFTVICGIMLVSEIILKLYLKNHKSSELYDKIIELTHGYWFKEIFCATVLSFLLLLSFCFLNSNTEDGYLAEHSKVIKMLQEELGLMNSHLVDISKNTDASVKHLEKIDNKMGELKKETSADPRKELNNLGIPWNEYSYRNALVENDSRILKLFWNGGLDPYYCGDRSNKPYGWKPDCPIIFHVIAYDNVNWRKLIKTFIDNGKMDINNDQFKPFYVMFRTMPGVKDNMYDPGLSYHHELNNNTFSPGQILLCQNLTLNKANDIKLINDLITLNANKKQLIDMLIILKDTMEQEYKSGINNKDSISASRYLQTINNGSHYLSELIGEIK